MTIDEIWKLAGIAAATATSISAIIALFTFILNSLNTKNLRNRELHLHEQQMRIQAWDKISSQITIINNFDVRLTAGISITTNFYIRTFDSNSRSEQRYTRLLFHHLNLLHIVHLNREYLSESEIKNFEDWGKYTLNCWIERVVPIQATLKKILEGSDLYGIEFVEFIQTLLTRPYRDRDGNTIELTTELPLEVHNSASGE